MDQNIQISSIVVGYSNINDLWDLIFPWSCKEHHNIGSHLRAIH